jgi:hypothetical protein
MANIIAREMQPVPIELMMAANQAIDDMRDSGADTLLIVSRALRGRCSTWDVVSIYTRLNALSRAFKDVRSNKFIIYVIGQDYKIMNEVLFHAAARAHLTYDEAEEDYVFDSTELMKVAEELWKAE